MTVQTITLPLTSSRRAAPRADDVALPTGAEPLALSVSTCQEVGRCDREGCHLTERVARRCPSLEIPDASV